MLRFLFLVFGSNVKEGRCGIGKFGIWVWPIMVIVWKRWTRVRTMYTSRTTWFLVVPGCVNMSREWD